ncbi:coenzyme Q-binding protein COQ10 [Schistosoma bovis]|nr:coenzyme Q-binding protein COQ10 [Schistosoma bovis]
MFDIAIDVGRYSEFIPWCNQSTVLEQGENNMLACLGVGFPPLSESYMSRITFQRPKHLKVSEYLCVCSLLSMNEYEEYKV